MRERTKINYDDDEVKFKYKNKFKYKVYISHKKEMQFTVTANS